MIPKGIPSQITQDAVVLMQVLAEVREDQAGVDQPLKILKGFLDFAPLRGEKAVTKIVNDNLAGPDSPQEKPRAVPGFPLTDFVTTEDDPNHADVLVTPEKAQKGPAAADLNVVTVGAEA